MATNVFKQAHHVTRATRAKVVGERGEFHGCTIWLTGFSGAGKSTIAFALEDFLVRSGIPAYSLDGDNIRSGLNKNLGFSAEDREENIRRIGEVARLFADGGIVCITAFISPFRADRDKARKLHKEAGLKFFEVFVDTPIEVCEQRDVKGLYRKAREGIIKDFTGIDAAYEPPNDAELAVLTDGCSVSEAVQQVVQLLVSQSVLPKSIAEIRQPELPLLGEQAIDSLQSLPAVSMDEIDLQWAQVLAEGWAHPLRGFMTQRQYLQSLHFGTVTLKGAQHSQSVPIVLAVSDSERSGVTAGGSVLLRHEGKAIGVLHKVELFAHNKRERCARTFGTVSLGHPSVRRIMESGDWLVGGELQLLQPIKWNDGMDHLRLTPQQLKDKFEEMEADAVFAFQLRNPVHNGHALLLLLLQMNEFCVAIADGVADAEYNK